jgi:proteasome lid subunit RPN8/RPN11
MPVAVCKLLTYKGQYSKCHIKVPDVDTKLPAVKIGSQLYSLFRRFENADAAMKVFNKLAKKGDELALTKQTHNGYVMWALELDAQVFKGPRQAERQWPTYGPANCLMLGDAKQYHQCYVNVPDLAEPMIAIQYDERFYSVYKPGLSAIESLDLAAQLTWRGHDSAITSTTKGYAVCLWEPEASPHAL